MSEKKIILIIVSIIILIIILFFFIRQLGIIDVTMPTGNVDIFDINFITNNDNCSNCSDFNSCKCNNSNISDLEDKKENNSCICLGQVGEKNDNNSGKQEYEKNNITVYDKQVEYKTDTQLNIFTHKSYYVKNDVIAPGCENSYQFIIRNNNDFAITYNLKMEENNPYNIKMKYRLKLNGEYILGNEENWVTAKDLIKNGVVLADNSYSAYTLDWKWFESDNKIDTEIGKNIDANYQLNIYLSANKY